MEELISPGIYNLIIFVLAIYVGTTWSGTSPPRCIRR